MRNTDILPFWEDTIASDWELQEEKILCSWLYPSEVQFPSRRAEEGGWGEQVVVQLSHIFALFTKFLEGFLECFFTCCMPLGLFRETSNNLGF